LARRPGAINLVHNRPSGDPTPSCADILMTQQIIAMASPRTQRVCDGRSGGFARAVDAVFRLIPN